MSRKAKVYSGAPHYHKSRLASHHGQVQCVVKTTSRKRAIELMASVGIYETLGHMQSHWSQTGTEMYLEAVRPYRECVIVFSLGAYRAESPREVLLAEGGE